MTRTTFLVAVFLVSAMRISWALDVTTCDTTVPPGETGVLQNDLSCAGAFVAVNVGDRATLDLNGHAIASNGTGSNVALRCTGRRCTVLGPGDISGPDVGIGLITGGQRLVVSDVDIHDCEAGIVGFTPQASKVIAVNVSATGCTNEGIWVGKLRGTGITASGNGGPGLAVDRLRARDVIASGNGASGVLSLVARVTNLVANGNGDAGVRAVKVALRDSTLTGNDGLDLGIDLLAVRRPRVVNTTCGKSGVLAGSGTWGVCADD